MQTPGAALLGLLLVVGCGGTPGRADDDGADDGGLGDGGDGGGGTSDGRDDGGPDDGGPGDGDAAPPACADECLLGATRGAGGAAETCRLYAEDTGGFVTPTAGGHTLARRHLAWQRAHHLPNGYVANTLFTSASHTTKLAYTGTVDAAEWTGTYLAAESLRALTTRSPDAIRQVEATIERVHQLFEITGTPGYMARFWARRDTDPLLAAIYTPADWSHVAVTYGGGPAFYQGWTSRDMYAGMALGMGLAYDATSSPSHRQMLRDVIVTLSRELIRTRTNVPVRVRYHAFGSWQQADLTYSMQHVILVPSEMVDGRVFIQVGSDADPSDYAASELRGAREFLPDMRTVLGQTPVIGALVPSIPRSASAMMLVSFLELALHVTEGDAGAAADRAAILAHWNAQSATWLAVMRQYEFHNAQNCWTQYFALAIAHHPLYTLLRHAHDPAFAASVRTDVLAARLRPTVASHRNAYFDFVAAAAGPPGLVPAAELATTRTQLLAFAPPPKAAIAVDNTAAYPANPDCPGQASAAVAIGARVPMDFLWQHHPFRLVNQFVDPRHVYPGTDYLLAYWLGRYHGLIEDDAPRTCTRWAPT